MLSPELTITPAEYVMMQIQVRGVIKQNAASRKDREGAKNEVDEILRLNGIIVRNKNDNAVRPSPLQVFGPGPNVRDRFIKESVIPQETLLQEVDIKTTDTSSDNVGFFQP